MKFSSMLNRCHLHVCLTLNPKNYSLITIITLQISVKIKIHFQVINFVLNQKFVMSNVLFWNLNVFVTNRISEGFWLGPIYTCA